MSLCACISFRTGNVYETSRDRHRVSVAAGTARYIPDIVVVMKGFSRSSVGQSYHVNSFADFVILNSYFVAFRLLTFYLSTGQHFLAILPGHWHYLIVVREVLK